MVQSVPSPDAGATAPIDLVISGRRASVAIDRRHCNIDEGFYESKRCLAERRHKEGVSRGSRVSHLECSAIRRGEVQSPHCLVEALHPPSRHDPVYSSGSYHREVATRKVNSRYVVAGYRPTRLLESCSGRGEQKITRARGGARTAELPGTGSRNFARPSRVSARAFLPSKILSLPRQRCKYASFAFRTQCRGASRSDDPLCGRFGKRMHQRPKHRQLASGSSLPPRSATMERLRIRPLLRN